MTLTASLAARGGAARLRDLPPSLRAAVQRGLADGTVAVHPGPVVALPGTPVALVHAVALRGVLCDLSAALYWGIAVLEPPRLTAVAVQASRRRLPGTEPVRRRLSAQDVDEAAPVTRPLRTVLDCMRHLAFRSAMVVANSATELRLVTPDDLVAGARHMRGPGTGRARAVARCVEPRCESPVETLLYLLLRELGVAFQLQVDIAGVGRVDALVGGWLVVEADGYAFHRSRQDYREDRRRANRLAAGGYVLVRLTYEDLVFERARTARLLHDVLSAGRRAG